MLGKHDSRCAHTGQSQLPAGLSEGKPNFKDQASTRISAADIRATEICWELGL